MMIRRYEIRQRVLFRPSNFQLRTNLMIDNRYIVPPKPMSYVGLSSTIFFEVVTINGRRFIRFGKAKLG